VEAGGEGGHLIAVVDGSFVISKEEFTDVIGGTVLTALIGGGSVAGAGLFLPRHITILYNVYCLSRTIIIYQNAHTIQICFCHQSHLILHQRFDEQTQAPSEKYQMSWTSGGEILS
jgi:hypothetical protein